MKTLLFLIALAVSININAQNWIDIKETIQVDDTIYVKSSGLPYNGLITETNESGAIIWKARCKKGLYQGRYFSFYDNGDTLQKGEYNKGKLTGFCYFFNSNTSFGKTVKPHCWLKKQYANGVVTGICESYFENGKVYISSTYVNNKQSGICKVYLESGELFASGKLLSSKAEGEWKIFNIDGSISSTLIFTHGKVISCNGNCDKIEINYTDFYKLTDMALGINWIIKEWIHELNGNKYDANDIENIVALKKQIIEIAQQLFV